ncbi:MAG: hypothetical protein Q4E99_02960, partial [Bacillota bacterium]|nr:hypothetical protein [Bacillota bacterium]
FDNIKHSYPETYLNVFANGKEEETLEFDTLSDVKSKVDIADLGILSLSAQDYLNILTKPINSSADIVDKYYFWKLISFVDNANEEKELADQAYALKEMQKAILGEIKNSDLVTIQLGADDLVATVLLGLIGSDPSDSAKEILAQLVDVKDGSVDIQLVKGAVSEIIAYLDDPNEEHYTEFAKYIQNLREYRSLVIFIAALDLIQSLKSENDFVKINAFLNFVQTAVKNGILTLDDLKAFLDVFDPCILRPLTDTGAFPNGHFALFSGHCI